ncbi:formylglycine-generating enzyme family protein [Hymenobacter canadensis]|uniref:SUMF1/EgtB/PvdO family nonheme iron enzyme n=1 Tax=Hymenobacter canadensis TaxID=2999067 RepID=A0ABY7LTK6_9BACT|nr:SUMF1/EgtB/PvdO family nonheme iron enzyme [Hymenobacter canadensis]WBA42742.1 SUMF1/EgtB/PvdO family nonheme iron enzyme [Hymenobacter canadensis]
MPVTESGLAVVVIDNYPAPAYRGFPDYATLQQLLPCPVPATDTLASPVAKARAAGNQTLLLPGNILLPTVDFRPDQAEVSNLEWQQFIRYLEFNGDSAIAARMWPRREALPIPEYFLHPFYHFYPVVGIEYEQVQAYCRWRSRQVTAAVWQGQPGRAASAPDTLAADYVRVVYRLPTETEWEYTAGSGVKGNPYGASCLQQKARINPGAAAYFKTRSGSSHSVAAIKDDIVAFNRQQTPLPMLHYRHEVPDFLALRTPDYVYSLAPSAFGLYHMLGNAAEMVQEKGVTKGGSYLDPLEACTVQARGRYEGPAPHIGFRCVCEVSFPNRR